MMLFASGGTLVAGSPMFVVAMVGVLVTMFLALGRAAIGPTVFDRILAANMFGTKTVLLIAVAGFMTGRPEWLDLAIVYALVNFAGTVAVAKYCRFGNLADDERGVRE
jgi:multicomponent Na+:H+ antiporter subunit F